LHSLDESNRSQVLISRTSYVQILDEIQESSPFS